MRKGKTVQCIHVIGALYVLVHRKSNLLVTMVTIQIFLVPWTGTVVLWLYMYMV